MALGEEDRRAGGKLQKKKASPLVSSKLSCIRSAAADGQTASASEEKGKESDGSMHCTLGKMSLAAGDAIEGIIRVRVGSQSYLRKLVLVSALKWLVRGLVCISFLGS